MGRIPQRCPPSALSILGPVEAIHPELSEAQAAHRAELGSLREMLAEHDPGDGENLDPGTSERMRNTVAAILRLQRIIARIDQ